MRRVLKLALVTAGVTIAAATPANAALVTLCSNGSGCETTDANLNLVDQTNTSPIVGTVNGTTIGVDITGIGTNGTTNLSAASGQATVTMADYGPKNADLINSVTFTLQNGATFGSAEWNLEKGYPTDGFTVTACVDTITPCDTVNVTAPQGSNWFDILYTGAAYTSVTITAPHDDGFTTFKQLRFDHVNAAVPEPATWAMMLLGFGGIGMAMRRRRKPALMQVA